MADWDPLDPTYHLDEPVGRGAMFERVLDTLEPLFDGELPPNCVVEGGAGAGKSAMLSALLSKLNDHFDESRTRRYTATRHGGTKDRPRFAYVDRHRATTRHKLYLRILEFVSDESVPNRGLGTDALETRIRDELAGSRGVVVVLDHVDESASVDEGLEHVLGGFDNVAWVVVVRSHDRRLRPLRTASHIQIPPYRTHELVDLLTARANSGLTTGLTHSQARRVAEWADGDAHDAVAGLHAATLVARDAGHTRIHDADIEVGTKQVPREGVSLGRVLALRENHQQVLSTLLRLDDRQRLTVEAASDAVAAQTPLSRTTVRRYLYELLDTNVLKRGAHEMNRTNGGEPPNRLAPNFAAVVFESLRERR